MNLRVANATDIARFSYNDPSSRSNHVFLILHIGSQLIFYSIFRWGCSRIKDYLDGRSRGHVDTTTWFPLKEQPSFQITAPIQTFSYLTFTGKARNIENISWGMQYYHRSQKSIKNLTQASQWTDQLISIVKVLHCGGSCSFVGLWSDFNFHHFILLTTICYLFIDNLGPLKLICL